MEAVGKHKVDRTGWGEGAWDHEPDELYWRTKAGLPGMIWRNMFGVLCGYVGVPNTFSSLGAADLDEALNVHGGITFTGPRPSPGTHCAKNWMRFFSASWIGFDCHHVDDYAPAFASKIPITYELSDIPNLCISNYRDLEYAKKEVESLAIQLVQLDKRDDSKKQGEYLRFSILHTRFQSTSRVEKAWRYAAKIDEELYDKIFPVTPAEAESGANSLAAFEHRMDAHDAWLVTADVAEEHEDKVTMSCAQDLAAWWLQLAQGEILP
jgi:hypothetical protein